jgi:hypothetical protein
MPVIWSRRKARLPRAPFCHGCDLLEDAVLHSGRHRRMSRESNKRFRCTGDHTDLANPTSLEKGYRANQSCGLPPSEPLKTAGAAPSSSPVAVDTISCDPSRKRSDIAKRIEEQVQTGVSHGEQNDPG